MPRDTVWVTVMLLVLVAAASPTSGQAAGVEGERPAADGGATRVETALYLIDLSAIDGSSQSFTADVFMVLRWHDSRLVSPGGTVRRLELDDVWNPRVQIVNQRSVRSGFPEVVDVDPDGTVTFRQRFSGEFSARLDLHDFPMDRHTLNVVLVTPGYSPDEIQLVPFSAGAGGGRASELSIVDWNVGEMTTSSRPYEVGGSGLSIAGLVGRLDVERKLGFYVSKAFVSIAIILCMSFVVLWLDPKYVPPRLSVAVTAMLTLIAYRFLLGQVLPPLSYLTRMDHFMLGSTFIVLMVLVEVVWSTHLHGTERPERARTLDLLSRIAFPAAFVVLVAAVFWPL